MNKKVIYLVVIFLLLVPFRLPIGVLFIELVSWIAGFAGDLSDNIMAANVIVTKIIYDLVLCSLSVYNVEMVSRKILSHNNRRHDHDSYWWTNLVAMILIAYICFDAVTTYDLYFELAGVIK